MLMRRIYQGVGLVFLALAAFFVLMSIVGLFSGGGLGGLFVGLMTAVFLGALGAIVFAFATGPALGGMHYFGVGQKAEIEREKSLVRKPQGAAKTAAK